MILKKTKVISIYAPFKTSAVDKKSGLPRDILLKALILHLQKSAPVGKLGNYDGVYELFFGHEGFTPGRGANPTLGKKSRVEIGPSACLRTFVDAGISCARIEKYCREVAAMHPWEHPVIEVLEGTLWSPRISRNK